VKDMVDPSGRSGAASGRRAARTPARTGRAAGRRRGAGAQARPEPWPRFGYLFDNAAADNRLRIAPALAALGAAAAPGLAAWQAGMGGGVAEDSAVLRWIAGRFAAWLSQPHALRPAEDEAPVLPGPPAAATLAPLDPGRVTADLVLHGVELGLFEAVGRSDEITAEPAADPLQRQVGFGVFENLEAAADRVGR